MWRLSLKTSGCGPSIQKMKRTSKRIEDDSLHLHIPQRILSAKKTGNQVSKNKESLKLNNKAQSSEMA
jgi:hypothetical protein